MLFFFSLPPSSPCPGVTDKLQCTVSKQPESHNLRQQKTLSAWVLKLNLCLSLWKHPHPLAKCISNGKFRICTKFKANFLCCTDPSEGGFTFYSQGHLQASCLILAMFRLLSASYISLVGNGYKYVCQVSLYIHIYTHTYIREQSGNKYELFFYGMLREA